MEYQEACILINNLLDEIVKKTDIANISQEEYELWLRTEVGFSDATIKELKERECYPIPQPEPDLERD